MNTKWNAAEIAGTIDHTVLKANATREDVAIACREALEYRFASVCVNPVFVQTVADELSGSQVKTCTVIGFPLGANLSAIKEQETILAVEQGADEVDMVINIGAMKAGDYRTVELDIISVVRAAGESVVKVIIETCYLSEDEKRRACELALSAGAHFVKTSTGFGSGGATVDDVRLMRETIGDRLRIKAAGGIRTYEDALAMLEAGADRIGSSSGVVIVSAAPR